MDLANINAAAAQLHAAWQGDRVFDAFDSGHLPVTPEHGYAIAGALARLHGGSRVGWKIAATAEAGRAHINVDRPLAGALHQAIVHFDGVRVHIGKNRMAVAEAEVVLVLGRALAPRADAYSVEEVADAVVAVAPGLELPDSRFSDFTKVGTACLIADNACARDFVIGEPVTEGLELFSLGELATELRVNGTRVTQGHGRDALGGPLEALTWLANTLSDLGIGLAENEFVTTGVTGKPSAIGAGDFVEADLGRYGQVSARLTT